MSSDAPPVPSRSGVDDRPRVDDRRCVDAGIVVGLGIAGAPPLFFGPTSIVMRTEDRSSNVEPR